MLRNQNPRTVCLFVAFLMQAAGAPQALAEPKAAADVIFVNGHIVTEDANDRVAEALAVKSGKILAVGSNGEIRALAGHGTRQIDLRGHTVTPGLIDTHAHLASGGLDTLITVDLSDASSIAEVRARIRSRAATLKPGEWLRASGWDEGKLTEGRYILASDIDDLTPLNPAWLDHTSGHYGALNSVAMKQLGINRGYQTPPAGTVDRDASGEPTGVVKESVRDYVLARLPAPTAAERRAGIKAGLAIMHREGMTAIKDADLQPAEWDAYVAVARAGELSAHVCALFHTDPSLAAAMATKARVLGLPRPPQMAAPNLVSCGVKIYMDGSGGARTAWMYDDWNVRRTEVDTGNKGYPALDPALYRQIVHLYHDAGIHIATHAVGDRAIDWVVDSYEDALAARPAKGLRHAIIHANTPTDHAIGVMAKLQQTYDAGYPETQGQFIWWIGDNYAGNLGPARSQRLNPYATYLANGIRWGGGSDYSVTPLPARYGLWSSVERRTLKGTYGEQPFGTAESVPITVALRSYTTWAAHQLFLDGEAGSLEPGKSADLAVWDRNLLAVPAASLKDLKCLMTVFRGGIVFELPGSDVAVGQAGRSIAAH